MTEQVQPPSELAKAYCAFFAEVDNVVKNAENPHFKSSYADLGAILDAVRSLMAKHKLSVLQAPGRLSDVAGNLSVSVLSVLMHASGQQISIETQLPLAVLKGGGYDPQKAGSAITYARRYALAAICGVAQVDDDGNAASAPGSSSEATGDAANGLPLMALIEAAGAEADLLAIKGDVQHCGDKDIGAAWVAKMRVLKKAK